jgi:hypothetical protein
MRDELTLAERSLVDVTVAEREARDWLRTYTTDADVLRDPRVIVPIAYDDASVVYWGVVGVKVLRMHASYPENYTPRVVTGCPVRGFVEFEPYMLVEQTLEIRRPATAAPLDRNEFRRICDKYDTIDALRSALEGE